MSRTGVARVVARIQSRHWAAIDRLLVHFYWASSLYELTFCSGRLLYKLNGEKRWLLGAVLGQGLGHFNT